MTTEILKISDVVKDFDGMRAIIHCSFEVGQGTSTCLIGPNGAGKTTIFNLITGFIKPTSGRIYFRQERIERMPPHKTFGKGIVRTFQIPREVKRMTVLENLMLAPSRQTGENVWSSWVLPFRVRRQERMIQQQALRVSNRGYVLATGRNQLKDKGENLLEDPVVVRLYLGG